MVSWSKINSFVIFLLPTLLFCTLSEVRPVHLSAQAATPTPFPKPLGVSGRHFTLDNQPFLRIGKSAFYLLADENWVGNPGSRPGSYSLGMHTWKDLIHCGCF